MPQCLFWRGHLSSWLRMLFCLILLADPELVSLNQAPQKQVLFLYGFLNPWVWKWFGRGGSLCSVCWMLGHEWPSVQWCPAGSQSFHPLSLRSFASATLLERAAEIPESFVLQSKLEKLQKVVPYSKLVIKRVKFSCLCCPSPAQWYSLVE